MSVYSVDYPAFVKDYSPPNKRGAVHLSWLNAVFVPLDQLHQSTFGAFRDSVIEKTKHNGQRIVAESILNDAFGVVSAPFIYIDNSGDDVKGQLFFNEAEGLTPVYLYNESEAQPPTYLVNKSEVTNNRRFVVYVPSAVYASAGETAIRVEVDRLRPYGTYYTIVQY